MDENFTIFFNWTNGTNTTDSKSSPLQKNISSTSEISDPIIFVYLGVLVGITGILMSILIYHHRKEQRFIARHPVAVILQCLISSFHGLIVVPLTWWINVSMITLIIFRALAILGLLSLHVTRYSYLELENERIVLRKLGKIHPTDPDLGPESDVKSLMKPRLILCVGYLIISYTIICSTYGFVVTTSGEIIFTMTVLPLFAILMFYVPHSLWDIVNIKFGIRDELVYVFMATSIPIFWWSATTAFALFLDANIVVAIRISIEVVAMAVSLFMCSGWVFLKIPAKIQSDSESDDQQPGGSQLQADSKPRYIN